MLFARPAPSPQTKKNIAASFIIAGRPARSAIWPGDYGSHSGTHECRSCSETQHGVADLEVGLQCFDSAVYHRDVVAE